MVLHNSGRLDLEAFGDESIKREAKLFSKQVDPYDPSYVSIYTRLNELEDETEILQIGAAEVYEYIDVQIDEPSISSWNDDLIKNPGGRYKYVSMELNFSSD